ncbi:MAG TPA: Gfo/Idh/MocA family oxidoreductase [Sphaerochaeta sp.]|nr:Gfo/Idh/MocA family oxidoreductase [Sphaerochaeta sp.]
MVTFGILGTGAIAKKFCEAVTMVADAEVVAVASRRLDRADEFANSWNIPRRYGSYEELLLSEKLDVVYIATTNDTHKDLCMQALRHKHNVLCEKPMVMHLDDAKSIFALAKENQCFIMEAMWSRFIPCLVKVRKWIGEGRIGKVHMANMMVAVDASANHRIRNKDLGGGILYDLGVYPLEILPFLLDKQVLDVRSIVKMTDDGIDRAEGILLDFGFCIASVHCSMDVGMSAPSVICGESGYISIYVGHKAKLVELFDKEGSLVESFSNSYTNGLEYQVEHVCACLEKGLLESPVVSYADTLACTALFEKILP